MKIEELAPEHKAALLQQPHQLFVVDGLLESNIGAFTSLLTFSNTSPHGMPGPVCTINGSTKDLYEIAKLIVDQIDAKKSEISKEYAKFLK